MHERLHERLHRRLYVRLHDQLHDLHERHRLHPRHEPHEWFHRFFLNGLYESLHRQLVGIERFALGQLARNDFPGPAVTAQMQAITASDPSGMRGLRRSSIIQHQVRGYV